MMISTWNTKGERRTIDKRDNQPASKERKQQSYSKRSIAQCELLILTLNRNQNEMVGEIFQCLIGFVQHRKIGTDLRNAIVDISVVWARILKHYVVKFETIDDFPINDFHFQILHLHNIGQVVP